MKEMRIFLIIVSILLVFSFGTVACSYIVIKRTPEEKKHDETKAKHLIKEAIKLKKSNMQESAIIDHLAYVDRLAQGRAYDSRVYFGKCPLSADQIDSLRKEGFQNDFIAKFEGQPQHVTLGVAGLWLQKTADLVYAPIIRIFLKPRSYFHAYRPYFFGRWGLSHQLNQSAFLNIGCALLPGDTKYVDSQFYVGFTLDANFLKEIGIIGK